MKATICFILLATSITARAACSHQIFCNETILLKVAQSKHFEDCKSFVDLVLKVPVEQALRQFQENKVEEFLKNCFEQPEAILQPTELKDWQEKPPAFEKIKNSELKKFALGLNQIWKDLARKVNLTSTTNCTYDCSSFLPEMDGRTIIIPGGRFRESYYWDTYWIIKGLIASDMLNTAETLVNNFILMIETYGMIPNGFRKYFLNRSQPPFLGMMIRDLVDTYQKKRQRGKADSLEERSFYALNLEHDYFMESHSIPYRLKNNNTIFLNIYNADTVVERPESFRQDHQLVKNLSKQERERVLKGLSTMAQSGWDFSSRWLKDPKDLKTTQINQMIPSDLNTLMALTQEYLIDICQKYHREDLAVYYLNHLIARKQYFSEIHNGVCFPDQIQNSEGSAARNSTYPSDFYPYLLFPTRRAQLGSLYHDAVNPISSQINNGQQWDKPNIWAPNNWILHQVLSDVDAERFAQEWVSTTYCSWKNDKVLYEKYLSGELGKRGQGGEYKVQAGFGWTNGLALHYLVKYGEKLEVPQC